MLQYGYNKNKQKNQPWLQLPEDWKNFMNLSNHPQIKEIMLSINLRIDCRKLKRIWIRMKRDNVEICITAAKTNNGDQITVNVIRIGGQWQFLELTRTVVFLHHIFYKWYSEIRSRYSFPLCHFGGLRISQSHRV